MTARSGGLGADARAGRGGAGQQPPAAAALGRAGGEPEDADHSASGRAEPPPLGEATSEALAAATSFIQSLVGNRADALAAFDRDLRYVYWNESMEALTGLPARVALGRGVFDLFPEARATGEDAPLLATLEGRQQAWTGTFHAAVRGASARQAFTVFYMPLRDPDGEVVGGVVVARDRQDSGHIEERLREVENRFKAMADSAPVLLWMSGRDALYEFFNQTWLTYTGRSLEDEVGIGWIEGVHPEDFQACMDTYFAAFNARRPFEMVYRLRRRDGAWRWVVDAGAPRYTSSGAFAGFIGSCVDITDRKAASDEVQRYAKELERSNAELQRYAYAASHDLQEPLRIVANYSELLGKRYADQLDDGGRRYLSFVREAALRMREMIRGVLAMSQLRELEAQERTPVNLAAVLAEVRVDLTLAVQEADAEVVADGPLPVVWGHRVPIRQLVQNLVQNALKFRDETRRLRVCLSAERQGDVWLCAVTDTGVGLDPEFAERAFDLFRRLHGRDRYPGAGMGLALCKRVVEVHDGRIWIESVPGAGTKVLFTLPALPPSGRRGGARRAHQRE